MKKWKTLSVEDISPSKWFPLYKHTVELPNGKIIDDYFVSHLGSVSLAIPITSEKKIIWVKQYKHGVSDMVIELPAGRIKENQNPEEGIKAELKEETGFLANTLLSLGHVCPSPTKDSTLVYGFIATDLVDTGETEFDETEDIEILYLSKEESIEKIKKGEIIGSDSIALFYRALLIYPELF